MSWVTLLLTLSAAICATLAQQSLFLEALEALNLSADKHFNAAVGAKVQVTPSEDSIYCEEGHHCLLPWWSSPGDSTLLPQTTEIPSACNSLSVTCDRRCPSVQYSTPTAQQILFDRVRCNKDGSSNLIRAADMTYPISVQTSDPCALSLNFVNGFSRTAGFHFHIILDIDWMRAHNDSQLLLLEGKLVTSTGSVDPSQSSDETFFWTLERSIDNSYYLTFYIINSAQFATAPRQMYRSVEPYRASTAQLSLFIRHIQSPGGATCFYVDGLKAVCLTDPQSMSRSIEFISLNSVNNLNLNTVSGSFLEVSLYEMGQPSAVVSESEIRKLYTDTLFPNTTEDSIGCLCQSTDFPFMKRSDWKAFSHYPSSYSKYCYADENDMSAVSLRYTDDQHGLADAFDGIEESSWLTASGIRNLAITLSFPHKIQVKALALSLSILPEYIKIYDSSSDYIASIQLECEKGDTTCTTWSEMTAGIDISQHRVPMLKWPLQHAVTTNGLVIYIEGTQERNAGVLLINDILIASTCYCAGDSTCATDNLASPIDTSINHRCECPQNITGVNCDLCSTGLYTTDPEGLVDHPSSCMDCGCETLGTCMMVNSSLCLNLRHDSCDYLGRCLCRSGNSTHYDERNSKCTAELNEIYPSYGPSSGGTRLTLRGKYLAAYDSVQLSNNQSAITTIVAATMNSVLEGGREELITLAPPASIEFIQFTLELPGVISPNFTFTYRPNPVVNFIQQRDVSVKGGLTVTVKGDYLDSSSRPVMLTYLFCAKSGVRHDIIISECQGNRTMLTCVTADLLESLSTMRCIVTTRLRRTAPITVERGEENDYSGIYAEFGLQFDGFSEYRHLNRTVKTGIYDDPSVFNLTEIEVGQLADTLSIKGKRLNRCCNSSDYEVFVGDEPCHIILLLEEEIICKLPDSWRISGADAHRNVTVTLGERETIVVGIIIKTAADNIWNDKKFVLTIASSCTATFILAMIVATVICCVYHKRFFTGKMKTKRGVQETKSNAIEQETETGNDSYQLQTGQFIKESQPQEEDIQYVMATELSLDLDVMEECDERQGQVCYVTEESPNSYSNKGYYEIEI